MTTPEEVNDMREVPSFVSKHKLECIAIGTVALLVIIASLRYSTPTEKTDASTVEQSIDTSTVKRLKGQGDVAPEFKLVTDGTEYSYIFPSGFQTCFIFDTKERAIESSWTAYAILTDERVWTIVVDPDD